MVKSIDDFDTDAELSVRSDGIDQFRVHPNPMQNRLDVKYELFLKWLQNNEMVSDTQTDDEFTSQVLTSDDEDDFVDTETDYPLISLPEVDSTATTPDPGVRHANIYSKLLLSDSMSDLYGGGSSGKATPTPSLLGVMSMTDYASSTSDISGISDNTKLAKRKAKHNKGKAPHIPIPLSVQLMQEERDVIDSDVDVPVPVEKKSILNFLPGLFRSKSPAKNPTEAAAVGDNDDKCVTQIWTVESV